MKKIGLGILFISLLMFLTNGCADSKTFTIENNDSIETTIVAEPYGWMNQDKKIKGVEYQICVGNIVWDVIFSETIIVPVVLTGVALWEPISYHKPNN